MHLLDKNIITLPLTSTIAYKSFPCKCTQWAVANQETSIGFYYRSTRFIQALKDLGVKYIEPVHKNPYGDAGATL